MTRAEWVGLARLINDRREEIIRRHSNVAAPAAYERQLMRASQLAALEDTARALARWLAGRSSRFNEDRFLAIAGVRSG